MRIAVTGGRRFDNYPLVEVALQGFDDDTELAHGDAPGADALAAVYALSRHWKVTPFPANWRPNGVLDRRAGAKRNQRLLNEFKPELLVAFPGRAGTADMIKRARKAGIQVLICKNPKGMVSR